MAPAPSSTSIQVESVVFPPAIKPPGTTNTLFLGGAGVRCVEIEGNFVKVTAIGVYLEKKAVPSLAVKWKGKSVAELTDSDEFYRDIVTGPFEKLTQITTIVPLTGKQFSEKSSGHCVDNWKAHGVYTDADATAVQKYLEVFRDESLPPGSSIFFTLSHAGSLTISLSKDGIVPEAATAVMENEKLGQALLETVLGKHGVSPEAKKSLASRISDLIKHYDEKAV